jgi:hypothetical protein
MTSADEVVPFYIELKRPTETFEGQIAEGAYVCKDGEVTLTDLKGHAVHDQNGKTYKLKLKDGEQPDAVARRLMRELRTAVRGTHIAGFGPGPINYPKLVCI